MEYWSVGFRETHYSTTPIFHYSVRFRLYASLRLQAV